MQATVAPVAPAFNITSHYDARSGTFTHLIFDPGQRKVAVVDPVLDLDLASGSILTSALDALIHEIKQGGWTLEWVLETHVHADHLSGADYLRQHLGGKVATGKSIVRVQAYFSQFYGQPEPPAMPNGGYDHLFEDGETFLIGEVPVEAWLVPGHTPADTAYVLPGHVFVGDTLFRPDTGTARADFPGGCSRTLYASIRRLLALPPETRLYMCHDYPREGRDIGYLSTVAEQRASNVHVRDGVSAEQFMAMREQRDATLPVPALMLAAVQANMYAGIFPISGARGQACLRIPVRFVSQKQPGPLDPFSGSVSFSPVS